MRITNLLSIIKASLISDSFAGGTGHGTIITILPQPIENTSQQNLASSHQPGQARLGPGLARPGLALPGLAGLAGWPGIKLVGNR